MSGWSRPGRLIGIALPMAMWALHFVVVYSVQGAVCARGGTSAASTGGLTSTSWWLLGLTVLALLVIAALGLRAWRAWRAPGATAPGATVPQPDAPSPMLRQRFASAATALSAALAAVAVLFTAVPILLLPPCV